MGRKKKRRGQRQNPNRTRTWHDTFLEMAGQLDYAIPNQLVNWRRFFINEESFRFAAEEWLNAKMSGIVWPRIEDDVDKGLMRQGAWYQEEDYGWDGVTGWGGAPTPTGKKWWEKLYNYYDLPMPHLLPAPSGLSGVDMASVF